MLRESLTDWSNDREDRADENDGPSTKPVIQWIGNPASKEGDGNVWR